MTDEPRTVVMISIKATPEERDTIRAAAAKLIASVPGARLSVSGFVMAAALERARTVLKGEEP